ncbi:MAG: VOC family protein [Acidimicrobiales bacterium]
MDILSSRVIIHAVDLSRSRAFYEDVLGLSIYRQWGVGVAYFIGGGHLELSGSSSRTHASTTLWLQLPSLNGVEAQLRQQGVPIVKPAEAMPWGLIELWVQDPDGNELRLIEIPETHPIRQRPPGT